MRLVLDTNVVISALLWRGTPYRLLETIRRQEGLQLYSSSALLEELTDVASRPAFTKRLATIGKTAPEIFVDYLEAVELVEPVDVPRVARDPDDDHVLACAFAASAELCLRRSRPARSHSLRAHSHRHAGRGAAPDPDADVAHVFS